MSDGPLKVSKSVADYKKGVVERAKVAREAKRAGGGHTPNLAEADAGFDPRTDAPRTLAAMGAEQRAVADPAAPPQAYSESTVAGLKELHASMETARAEAQKAEAPPPVVEEADATPKESEKEMRDRLNNIDDLEFSRRMDAIQKDVINNTAQKDAVGKRLENGGKLCQMDLEDGLVSGVYEQTVPITPKFNVRYRSITPMENRAMRLLLWKWIDDDPRVEHFASDVYGMMLIVAGVVQIGTNKLPTHLTGSSPHTMEFDPAAFKIKYDWLDRYPSPMIHAIGVHANWFDERVRLLFTTETIKDF